MTCYNLVDYWDFASPNEGPYEVDWYNASKSHAAHAKNYWTEELGGCTRQDDYYGAPNKDGTTPWQDSWYYINDPNRGVMEIADNAPKVSVLEKILLFWYPYKHMVYKKGKEIPWGHVENFGDPASKTSEIEIDHLRSAFLPPFPGFWSLGKQINTYIAHLDEFTDCLGRTHSDVLQMHNMQPWGKIDPTDMSCTGCIYYLVKGIGRVAVQYMTYDKNLKLISKQDQTAAVYSGSKVLRMETN